MNLIEKKIVIVLNKTSPILKVNKIQVPWILKNWAPKILTIPLIQVNRKSVVHDKWVDSKLNNIIPGKTRSTIFVTLLCDFKRFKKYLL